MLGAAFKHWRYVQQGELYLLLLIERGNLDISHRADWCMMSSWHNSTVIFGITRRVPEWTEISGS